MDKTIKYVTQRTTYEVKAKITPIEIERETDSSVWINGKQIRKVTDYEIYHDTWDVAHAYLLKCATYQAQDAQKNLINKNEALNNVNNMKQPG